MKNNSNKDKKISLINYSALQANSTFEVLKKMKNPYSVLQTNSTFEALKKMKNPYSALQTNSTLEVLKKMKNPYSALQTNSTLEVLKKMKNPYSVLQTNSTFEVLKKMKNPYSVLQTNSTFEALKKMKNPYSALQTNSTLEVLKKMKNPYSVLQTNSTFEALKKMKNPYSVLQTNSTLEVLKKMKNPYSALQTNSTLEVLKKMKNPYSALQTNSAFEALKKMKNPYSVLQTNSAFGIISKMNYSTDILNTTMKNLNKIISENKNIFDELDKQSKVTDYKKENDTLDRDVVFNGVDACLKQPISFQEKLHNIFENFKKLNPIYWLLIYVLLINPLLDYYNAWCVNLINTTILNSKSKSTNNEVEDKKVIKYNVNNNINIYVDNKDMKSDILKKYRFVTTQALYVRINHSIKSRVVCKIYFGQSVRIIRKKKNWTLVEVNQKDTNNKIIGWVFTRYISRFD